MHKVLNDFTALTLHHHRQAGGFGAGIELSFRVLNTRFGLNTILQPNREWEPLMNNGPSSPAYAPASQSRASAVFCVDQERRQPFTILFKYMRLRA